MDRLKRRQIGQQLLLTFLIAAILFAVDFTFLQSKFSDRFPRRWMSLPETWGVVLLLSFAFRKKGLFWASVILLLLTYIQMLHLSFFGSFIHPTGIYLFFTQFGEVWETTTSLGRQFIYPTTLFAGALTALIFLFRKNWDQPLVWRPWVIILALLLVYSPIRTFVAGNTYGKQPSIRKMAFSNLYSSTSYFLGRTLPFKLTRKVVAESHPPLKKISVNPNINVIFILGESLRYDNMSLFGYSRETTPHLEELAKTKGLFFRRAISGGVSTDVAIPLLINNAQSKDPVPLIASQSRCLYKLAKENGFETHFFSAQTISSLQHILNYICAESIDEIQLGASVEMEVETEVRFYDEILLKHLETLNFSKPQFVVFHQRGSHSPYHMRYPPDFEKFKAETGDSDADRMIKAYDNSVAYTDQLLFQLITKIFEKSNRPTYIVFTSDHGQALGENGVWGHVMLSEHAFRVPFLFISNQKDSLSQSLHGWPDLVTHKEISGFLTRLLGYEYPGDIPTQRQIYVMGADLDGLEGGMLVNINGGNLEHIQKVD